MFTPPRRGCPTSLVHKNFVGPVCRSDASPSRTARSHLPALERPGSRRRVGRADGGPGTPKASPACSTSAEAPYWPVSTCRRTRPSSPYTGRTTRKRRHRPLGNTTADATTALLATALTSRCSSNAVGWNLKLSPDPSPREAWASGSPSHRGFPGVAPPGQQQRTLQPLTRTQMTSSRRCSQVPVGGSPRRVSDGQAKRQLDERTVCGMLRRLTLDRRSPLRRWSTVVH
jgi:hypothetical protein